MKQSAALGLRAHSGWAVVVAVAGSISEPIVLDRRRLELAAAGREFKQPYHAAAEPSCLDPGKLIERCRETSEALASQALSALVESLAQRHRLIASGLLIASGRPLPDLPIILKSHALIHTAEGEFFRDVLAQASERCSSPVTRIPERGIWERAAQLLGLEPAHLQQRIQELGRALGPPWRQDEKLATLAAWIALAESGRRR